MRYVYFPWGRYLPLGSCSCLDPWIKAYGAHLHMRATRGYLIADGHCGPLTLLGELLCPLLRRHTSAV
jgi:hypothetical protein